VAPLWPVTVDIMMKSISAAEETYFKKEAHKGLVLKFNLTNISAIIGKVESLYLLIELFSLESCMGICPLPSEKK